MYDSPRLHDPSFTFSKSHGLSPANTNQMCDTSDSIHKIHSVETECDDNQTTTLMNCFEFKKQKKKLQNISTETSYNLCFYFLKITSKWSSWH